MAAFSSKHTRSISMPSRSHPLTLTVEEHLYSLKSSSQAESSSSSSVCHKLSGLKDLYESVSDMLQMSNIQQALSHQQHIEKWAEDVLEGSLKALDACGITRDAFSTMKGSVQDLQSALRRKRGEESGLANEIKQYMVSRKNVNKMASKSLRNLKKMENKHSSVLLDLDRDSNLIAIVGILREVEEISLSVFESLLSFISKGGKSKKNTSSWSLVSKLMQSKRVACEEEDTIDEVEKINEALNALNSQKTGQCMKIEQVQNLLKPFEALESSIQELEDELEYVFSRIIKTRVSLLNILSPYISFSI